MEQTIWDGGSISECIDRRLMERKRGKKGDNPRVYLGTLKPQGEEDRGGRAGRDTWSRRQQTL